MSAANYTLKPCPKRHIEVGPHELAVWPCDLGASFSPYVNVNKAEPHQVICPCGYEGPIGSTFAEAVRKHNESLP